ncbi:MAG: ARPP-1 family domain-containing protein [Candidatus Thorarchaeota archaeon]
MKNESIQVVKSIFEYPLSVLKLANPQVYENMTIIPLIIQDDKIIEFISITEAEELELIEIVETDTVNQLEVINKSNKQILIPFGMTVKGGKQDRTIWEPILLPVGGKQNVLKQNPRTVSQKYTIPAKCIEQSRWNYTKGRAFKSSNMRLHPNVAYEAISAGGQSGVWNEIQSHRTEMNYAMTVAPTQSYLEMTENSKKKLGKIVKHFENIRNQCGIVVFINDEFIGMEFYANSQTWKTMSHDILKAFSIEALRFKDKTYKLKKIDYHIDFINTLINIDCKFTVRKGVGLGNVVEFNSNDNKWRGITLVIDDIMAQFYFVSKRGGYQVQRNSDLQFQTIINRGYL